MLEDREGEITNPGHALGSPHYMSPEQVLGLSDVDARTDVWSLGVILYELLTGNVPFPFETPDAIVSITTDPIPLPSSFSPDITADLEAIVMRALEKERSARFQTIRELAIALAPFAPDEVAPISARFTPRPVTVPPASMSATIKTVPPPAPPRSRRAVLVILAVVAVGGVAFWQYGIRGGQHHAARPEPPPPTVVRSAPPPPSPSPSAAESAPLVVEAVTTISSAPSATTPRPPMPRPRQRPQPSTSASSPPPPVSATPSAEPTANPLML